MIFLRSTGRRIRFQAEKINFFPFVKTIISLIPNKSAQPVAKIAQKLNETKTTLVSIFNWNNLKDISYENTCFSLMQFSIVSKTCLRSL